uniref:alpha-1,2-Mannosidase n=1 Tax=Pyramimonas obovata TaxID=1411642 RepID=A0A7S0RWM0_9CHLO|mmetsp:Transcript_8637/g.17882  ORF Transcript_8637/g.17882 Transcript_8637/m.17882 type:complete len:645 (+) Transcript_8637:182-2116(+)
MKKSARSGSSRSLVAYFHPASLARRPQRILPLVVAVCITFFIVLEKQRESLELSEGGEEGPPSVGQAVKMEDLAKLSLRQQMLIKENRDLANEAHRIAESLKMRGMARSEQANKGNSAAVPSVSHVPARPDRFNPVAFNPSAVGGGGEAHAGATLTPRAPLGRDTHLPLNQLNVDLSGWVKAPADVERREAVKRAMQHAWRGYERYAFGMDELQPNSHKGKNMFAGLGATIIDSLDTLWIMDMKEEFNRAKEWVATKLNFNVAKETSVFETVIRIVGGFISAYDLSGDRMFVDKCVELVDRLMPAYRTPTGIPYNIINLATGASKNPAWTQQASTLAEFGTQQLEFVALSHHAGDDKYARMAEHVIKYATDPSAHRNRHPPPNGAGLYPLYLNPISGMWTGQKVSFGAMGDSFFEYLIKMWVQGGRTPALRRYRELFDDAMDSMIKVLVHKSSPSGMTYVAEWNGAALVHKMDHLACFVPGMLALGANGDNAEQYVSLAQDLTHTCVQMYKRQPSGLAPEFVLFHGGQDMVSGAHHNLLRPETVEALMILFRKTGDPIYREWGWEIFQAFETHCKTQDGYAGLRDVRQPKPVQDDTMQSFFLAETLKYLYLLFDDTAHIAMDEWVFNTEAHPLKIFHRDQSFVN